MWWGNLYVYVLLLSVLLRDYYIYAKYPTDALANCIDTKKQFDIDLHCLPLHQNVLTSHQVGRFVQILGRVWYGGKV